MKKIILAAIALLLCSTSGHAQAKGSTVYIATAMQGTTETAFKGSENMAPDFSPTIASAILTQKVPVAVTVDKKTANDEIKYVVQAKNGSRAEHVAGAALVGIGGLFMGRGSVTVSFEVIDLKTGTVVYSYTSRKGGDWQKQFPSAAKDFASHWKHAIEQSAK